MESDETRVRDTECACTLKILALYGIAGASNQIKDAGQEEISPYHLLIKNCPPELQDELFGCDVIRILTQFKWEMFAKGITTRRLQLHMIHFVLSALALMSATQVDVTAEQPSPGSASAADAVETSTQVIVAVLMGCMTLGNTGVLISEVKQMYRHRKNTGRTGGTFWTLLGW